MIQNIEKVKNIKTECDGDLIFVTVAKYKLFLSYGKIGIDAYVLYSHLMFTARLQGTNQVKAKDIYLRAGLEWGEKRVKRAKRLLYDLNLIELIRVRDNKGIFTDSYLRVETRTTPFEIKSVENQSTGSVATPVDSHPGGNEEQMLKRKSKCLNEKVNTYTNFYETIFNKWIFYKDLMQHKSINTFKKQISKNKVKDILEEYSLTEVTNSIDNYNFVLTNSEYTFTYRWPLWDFLNRGLHKFVDLANPLTNYKKRNYNQESQSNTVNRRIVNASDL
jgi:hypothetical protein